MDSIIVKVADLAEQVRQLVSDKMQEVELLIVKNDKPTPDNPAISFLSIEAWKNSDPDFSVCYDGIDSIETSK